MKNLEYVSGLRFELRMFQTWIINANHNFSFSMNVMFFNADKNLPLTELIKSTDINVQWYFVQ